MTDTNDTAAQNPAPAFTVTGVRDLHWGDVAKTQILCEVKFSNFDDFIPFGAMANDTTAHGRQIFNDCTNGSYGPIGAYKAPTLSPQAQYDAAISLGVVIICTSNPSLSGVYAADTTTMTSLGQTAQYVNLFTSFPGGTTLLWLDSSGQSKTFDSTSTFMDFAKALMQYVAACGQTLIALNLGTSQKFPPDTITIS